MPKENTHLWFGHGILEHVREADMLADISAHIDSYHLGSIIPDTFFYSSRARVFEISESLHGKGGSPTNTAILMVLDEAKGSRDIAFILGYITHCALDAVFHPVVNSLAGNYYDDDPVLKARAAYLHRHLETGLDVRILNPLRLHCLISARMLKGMAFEGVISRIFVVPARRLRVTLAKQILFDRLFAGSWAYNLAGACRALGALKSDEPLSLFYKNLDNDPVRFEDPVRYHDQESGAEKVVTLDEMFARAREKALRMMKAAYGYAKGRIGRERLIEIIPGESLSTGKIPGCPAPSKDMRDM